MSTNSNLILNPNIKTSNDEVLDIWLFWCLNCSFIFLILVGYIITTVSFFSVVLFFIYPVLYFFIPIFIITTVLSFFYSKKNYTLTDSPQIISKNLNRLLFVVFIFNVGDCGDSNYSTGNFIQRVITQQSCSSNIIPWVNNSVIFSLWILFFILYSIHLISIYSSPFQK
jgi:hypothetical protein